MEYTVRIQDVEPRQLAVVHGSATRPTLGRAIIAALDQVWAVLRAQALKTDHNVVLYRDGLEQLEIGVEIPEGGLVETEVVRRSQTPSGRAVTVTHRGDYADLAGAYAALEQFCQEHQHARSATSWEVYGDWSDNPTERQTDIYWLLASDTSD